MSFIRQHGIWKKFGAQPEDLQPVAESSTAPATSKRPWNLITCCSAGARNAGTLSDGQQSRLRTKIPRVQTHAGFSTETGHEAEQSGHWPAGQAGHCCSVVHVTTVGAGPVGRSGASCVYVGNARIDGVALSALAFLPDTSGQPGMEKPWICTVVVSWKLTAVSLSRLPWSSPATRSGMPTSSETSGSPSLSRGGYKGLRRPIIGGDG